LYDFPPELYNALTSSSLVHVATHGTSHFIVIKGSAEDAEDYEFCADDIFKLKDSLKGPLSPVLVVLNTCAGTPYSELPSIHSNILNLVRALHSTGVKCVVSSSTRVEDSIAEDIMETFYK
jgi:CHAT domain-containing protein